MKVALCISGQPRTWERCYQNWLDNILPNVEKDVFFHFWDYNTLPSSVNTVIGADNNRDIPIDDSEKQRILDALKPKRYMFDNRNLNPIDDKDHKIVNDKVKHPLGWWCRSQFYSLWYAARIKRMYEIENKFEYDLVFRLRTDVIFQQKVNVPEVITSNSLYTTSNGWMENVRTFLIGDTFYFCDSFVYDQVSEYIHALQYMDTYDVVDHDVICPPPEVGLYPFVRSLGIKNISYPQHFKILRTQEYVDIKGGLHAYEII